MLVVETVEEGGTGGRLGLQRGDRVLEVNGQRVRDELDFQFLGSDEDVTLKVARANRTRLLRGRRRFGEPWGLRFAAPRYRSCGNKCIFCFVDQNPKGLRPSLYFKDEDYRLSFLHGNYVTLTNVGPADIRRIVTQRLSPLYVSVHATQLEVRKRLLGIDRDDHLLDKISALVDGGIRLHAQIVLLPGCNDGTVLGETLNSLWGFWPGVASVAVVPVGLTKYRQGLPPIRPVTGAVAAEVVRELEERAREFKSRAGVHWVYLADEFYLICGEEVPSTERYDDFPQIENGIGMMRSTLDAVEAERSGYPRCLPRETRVLLVTGRLAAPSLARHVLPVLRQVKGLEVELLPVRNDFFGDSVTVSGLLVGRDIIAQVRQAGGKADLLLLPANVLNADGLLLDDLRPSDLEAATGIPVMVLDNSFAPVFEKLGCR